MNKSKIIIIVVSAICVFAIIEAIVLLGNGTIYNKYKCPDTTYKLQNNRCIKTEIVDTYDKLICPDGYEVSNNTCTKTTTVASKVYYTCDKGYTLDNQSCVKKTVINRIKKYTCSYGATQSQNDKTKCLTYEAPLTRQEGTELVKYCKKGTLKNNSCVITSKATETIGCPDNYSKTAKNTCTRTEKTPAIVNRKCDKGYTLEGIKCVKTDVVAGTYEEACNVDYVLKDGKCYRDIDIIATKDSLF